MAIFTAIGAAIGAIGGAIGALSTFTIGNFAAGAFLLQTAAGIGLNLLAQAIAGKPKTPTPSINGTLQAGGDVPRSFIVGPYMTAGSLVWANTWGKVDDTPNAFMTQVIAIDDLPVGGLVEVWCNGEKCTLLTGEPHAEMGYPVQQYRKDGNDSLWIKFYDGTQTEVDEFLRVRASNGQRTWDDDRVGYGVAYAICSAKVTKNMFSGIPSFKFVVDGIPLYDISKDSTAGGDGPQRWSDPSTWGGDGDHLPAVQAYNLLRGIQWNGEWFYGVQGLSGAPARLPAANWIAAIEKCRAAVEGNDGPEPAYRSAGEITVDVPLATALEAINTTCQGRISEVGGVYSMYLGAPDEPSFSFSDGDILSTEEQSFTPFFGLADTINGIFANYPSPKDGWVSKSAPPLHRTDLEAKHGNRRLMADVELAFVPYPEQVQRLMKQALQEGQRARRHTIVLPPEFWAYAVPGAVCAWTSERNGYGAKLFRVDGVADRANLDVMIDITEVDPADYDWDSETDYQPPVDGPTGPIRPQPAPIIDWFAEPATITNGADVRPGLKLTWDGTKTGILGVEFQVRLASTEVVVHQGRTDDAEAGAILISQNLFSNTLYGVRGRYILDDQDAEWSDWLAVTTPDVRDTDVLAKLGNLGNDVKAQLTQLRMDAANVRSLLETLAAAAVDMAAQASQGQSVAVRRGDALAAAMSELSAEVTEDLEAFASAITAVLAQVGPTGAQGLFRISAEATPGDAQARIGLSVSATANGITKLASIFLDALASGKSRVVLLGDQVAIADSLGNVSALFEAGGVYINTAKIHNLDATNITAAKLDAAAVLQNGTLITELLSIGAVTEYEPIYYTFTRSVGGGGSYDEGGWTHHGTVIVTIPTGMPAIEFLNLTASGSRSGGTAGFDAYIVIRRNGNATSVSSGEATIQARRDNSNGTTNASATTFIQAGTATVRYDIWTWNTLLASPGDSANLTVTCSSGVLVWKR